jgi:hypothetical protein
VERKLIMRLTKYQKARMLEFGWDVVENEVDGETQNCSWISIDSEDGVIYNDAIKLFGLSGDGKDIKLLVVGTREEDEE